MRLKDKVAIITGGSRGIGYATADKFLGEGARVILTASSQASAEKAVERLKEKYPDAIIAGISPDLASLESVREAFRSATEKYGCVDILVNNAGVSESTPFMEYTEETFDKVMDLNVKGVFNTTRRSRVYGGTGDRRDPFHVLNGQHLRSAQRFCLSRIQICGEWTDRIAGPRIGTQGHPCERGCSWDYGD